MSHDAPTKEQLVSGMQMLRLRLSIRELLGRWLGKTFDAGKVNVAIPRTLKVKSMVLTVTFEDGPEIELMGAAFPITAVRLSEGRGVCEIDGLPDVAIEVTE